jgi:glycosyltransferase involved in cell wall biosynthesis
MRVLVDCRWLVGPRQGVVTYITQLHEALLSRLGIADSQITLVYAVPKLADIEPNLIPSGVEILEFGYRSFFWRLFIFPLWLKHNNIDIAHFQYVSPLYKLKCKYIVTIHDIIFVTHPKFFSFRHKFFRLPLYWFSSKYADLVLTVSEQSQIDIADRFGRTDAVIIHNGFAPKSSHFRSQRPKNIHDGHKYLLTVGRVEPRKNYPRLIDGFEKSGLRQLGYDLVIVGHFDREFIEERDLISNRLGVKFLEYVDDKNLLWLYENASGFIYPSICEGFGIPVLEALEHQIPVAVSDTYPLEDVKQCGVITFNPLNTDEIASACVSLIKCPQKTVEIERLRQTYNWEHSALQYHEAINRLSQ